MTHLIRKADGTLVEADAGWLATLAPQAPNVAQVKAEAARRLAPTDWYVIRAAEGGTAAPANVLAYRAAVRDASNNIEVMDPIPRDFADDSYWPEAPTTENDNENE